MMQNGRMNSPKLRPHLSSSEKLKSKNMSTCLEREVSIKTKYGHRSIMYLIITATNFNKTLTQNFYHSLLMN